MYGLVIFFLPDKQFGYLEDQDGKSRLFSYEVKEEKWQPSPGEIVMFRPYENRRSLEARRVRPADLKQLGIDNNQNLIEEISEWKLEAKFDDNNRYFYPWADLPSLESGKRCFVIGRKGTGKTAI